MHTIAYHTYIYNIHTIMIYLYIYFLPNLRFLRILMLRARIISLNYLSHATVQVRTEFSFKLYSKLTRHEPIVFLVRSTIKINVNIFRNIQCQLWSFINRGLVYAKVYLCNVFLARNKNSEVSSFYDNRHHINRHNKNA